MIDYIINNYKGKPKYVFKKHGKRILSWYKYQMIGHNASGLDNYIVLNSIPSSYKCIKIIKTTKRLIKLSFKAGSAIEDDREIPKYMKFVCSKCHISGSLKSIQKEKNIQPDLMKVEINHDLINITIYKDYENLWRPYLIDDVLRLACVSAKQGNSFQKIIGVSYKNSLMEAALGGSCLVRSLKEDNRILYTPENKYVRDFIKKTVHGSRVLAFNKKIVSKLFKDVVNVLEKCYGEDLEVSVLFDKYFEHINTIENYYKEKDEARFTEYRQINTRKVEEHIERKIARIPISKQIALIDKSDLFVSSDYNSLHPSAMAHPDSKWPKKETVVAVNTENSDRLCSLFNNCEWKDLNESGFFKMTYYNPKEIFFHYMGVKENVFNARKNRYEEINL